MKSSTVATLFAIIGLAAATPTPEVEEKWLQPSNTSHVNVVARDLLRRDNFANFFNGPGCTGGQGSGVDITNAGCLGESGRQSVYIPRTVNPSEQMCLVITDADGSCSCQSEGYNFTPTGFCAELDDPAMASAQSFRFVGAPCGGNNC